MQQLWEAKPRARRRQHLSERACSAASGGGPVTGQGFGDDFLERDPMLSGDSPAVLELGLRVDHRAMAARYLQADPAIARLHFLEAALELDPLDWVEAHANRG